MAMPTPCEQYIGISNCVFGRRPPREDDFRIIKENGITHIEMSLRPGWFDTDSPDLIDNVCGWIDKFGLAVHSVHGPSGFPGESPTYQYSGFHDWIANPITEERRHAVLNRKKYINIAALLGAKYFIIENECYGQWPFWPHHCTSEIEYPESGKFWEQSVDELVDDCLANGMTAAIENIDGLSNAPIVEFIESRGSGMVGICFDSSHATYGDFLENMHCLLLYTITTHISDNDGLLGNQWIDRHWMPFRGNIDWDQFLAQLVENSYTGAFILEMNPMCDFTSAAMKTCLLQFDTYISQHMNSPDQKSV